MSQGTTELDRPVPLYMQVVRQLRARIASGELAEGGRIPSQREMMQIWRISMQTASKVIGALKTEGLAIPSVGRDTIVADGAAARIAAAAQGTAHGPASPPPPGGGTVTGVTAARAAAPVRIAEILGIPAGRRALRRQETCSGDGGQAVGHTTAWYPPAVVAAAPRLAGSQPLPAGTLAYISEATTTRVARAAEDTTALPADDDTAALLGVPPGSPVLVTRTQYHASDGSLLEYAETTTPAGQWRTRTYTLAST
ncbi:MAG TPA: GntR family transcriptional regulator [Streptosporangiaceae bacterium]